MEILDVTRSAAKYLRERIITGEIKGGERLNELQITAELGISRAPLREAFRILENDHLVESIPRKGTFVAKVSERDLNDLYAAREMIEGYAIELIREKNISHIPGLDPGSLMKGDTGVTPQNVPARMITECRIVSGFHPALVSTADNKWIRSFYRVLSRQLARYQFLYLKKPTNLKKSIKEHKRIEQAITEKDYDSAKDILLAHLRCTHRQLKLEIRNHH